MDIQKTEKTLLEKIDFFQIIFAVHIFGLLIQPNLELVIPLHHPMCNADLIRIILYAWTAYLLGKLLEKLFSRITVKKRKNLDLEKEDSAGWNDSVLWVIIFLLSAAVTARYLSRGIPLFSSSPGLAKGYFLADPTYGCTRILYIILPLLCSFYLASCFQQKILFSKKGLIIFLFAFIPLFLGLFKGAVITFIGGLILLFDKFYERIHITLNLKTIFLATVLLSFPVMQYYFSEGQRDFQYSLSYVSQRLFIYGLEGFNFIYYADLPSNFVQQANECFGLAPLSDVPGYLLTRDMIGRYDVDYATVTTLYGFCWRNGRFPMLLLVFFLLGIVVSRLMRSISTNNHSFWVTMDIYLYIVFLKMLLVGEPFNDLRGPILSLLFTAVLFLFLTKIFPNRKITDA